MSNMLNNTQVVLKNFKQGLMTIDMYVYGKFLKGNEVKQEKFNALFAEANHNGHDDLKVRLIEQADSKPIM